MLNVSKNEVLTEASVNQATVRQKELDYFTSNYWTWGSISTVFVGFVFDQLKNNTPEGTNLGLEIFYLSSTVACLCSNLCVITWTAFMCIWGPGLALRGADGMNSLNTAVEFLDNEQYVVYKTFYFGVVSFFFSAVANLWVFPSHFAVNCSCSVLFGIAGILIFFFQYRISDQLKGSSIYNKHKATSGRINAFERLNIVGDLDTLTTAHHDRFAAERTRRGQPSGGYAASSFSYR